MARPCGPGGEGRPECSNHPGSEAVARCVSCGSLLCAHCRVVEGNRNYCRSTCQAQVLKGPQSAGRPASHQPPRYGQASWPGREHGYPPPPGGVPPPPWYPPGGQYGYQYPPYAPAARFRKPREVVFPGAPWGVGEALIIFALSFMAASAVTFGLYMVLRELVSTTTAAFLLIFFSSVVLYALLLGGTFYSVKVRHKSTVSALGLKMDGLGRGLAWGLGLGLPLFVGAILLAYLSEQVLRNTNTPDMVSRSVNKISSGNVSAALVFLLFVTLVLLAPLCEEIFFRGYLYPALRNRMDRQPAMLLNGVLFAAAHFEVIGFLPRFLLGYGLCYMYERRHNLVGPITGHALYNGMILVMSVLFQAF